MFCLFPETIQDVQYWIHRLHSYNRREAHRSCPSYLGKGRSRGVSTTVNAVNFAGLILAAQKHSRVVKFTLSRYSLDIFVLHKYLTSYKAAGQHKTKQASHILQYVTHLHQHTW